MRVFGRLLVCFVLMGSAVAMVGPDWEALGKRWWAHVQFLADDKLEGRDTGSAGFEKAATYVTEQFRKIGLKPAGEKGYAQSVEFNVMQIDENGSSIELVRDGKSTPVKLGDEAFFGLVHSELPATAEAAAVFVGYGLTVPELNYDDFAGQEVRGKMAVYVKGGPKTMSTEIKAHYQSGDERRKALQKAGAVGVAEIPNPRATEVPWSRTSASRLQPDMELSDKAAGKQSDLQVALAINPAYADALFAGSAHMDHLGIGAPVNGDKIYNGAMDDASGIASLLEIARGIKESGAKPKRSILFLAVTGEEKGLLGSRYFAEHPTAERKNIVADLNMDMYLPLFPLKYLEVQGLNESTLGEDIRAVCAEAGVQVQADKQPDHNRFIRSDQYSFIRKGVPALAFKFGWVPGTPEEKKFNDWYKERYHGPADDLSQPVNQVGAAQFDSILETLTLRVADAPSRPEWKKDSFFRRYAQ